MVVSMTIRDVPDETRDELAARAARAGQSLQEYVRAQLTALARRPSPDDLWARVQQRVEATGTRLSADSILEAGGADPPWPRVAGPRHPGLCTSRCRTCCDVPPCPDSWPGRWRRWLTATWCRRP